MEKKIKNYGPYGEVAIEATRLFPKIGDPREAWTTAAYAIIGVKTKVKKCNPRSAYLGLCEIGLVKGIPAGTYTLLHKSVRYTLCALEVLRDYPNVAQTTTYQLWNAVTFRIDRIIPAHNQGQMDVVMALWNENLIIMPQSPHAAPGNF